MDITEILGLLLVASLCLLGCRHDKVEQLTSDNLHFLFPSGSLGWRSMTLLLLILFFLHELMTVMTACPGRKGRGDLGKVNIALLNKQPFSKDK